MDYTLDDSRQAEKIEQLFLHTFSDSEGEAEGQVIAKLAGELINTTAGDERFVFVATEHQQLAGCIIFSRLTFPGGQSCFLLAPVAVHTDYQGLGVGQALIRYGLETLKQRGAELVMTYGDIRFYSKVGFVPVSEDIVKAPLALTYPQGWLGQALKGEHIAPINGTPRCVEAINHSVYW
ncbi:N-acetyltransferase [Vibrio sp. CAU 1672]|uniref:GNAT family N-acetyltransferase n=1 Tax=Vibrio sp. CAU 1672 TaxID=3032594 RepID=UPI0023DA8E46|nr:N-acetyltransferase [Vibrio sp. CAU 1672]MDF2152301.1 N-acetyltransferase [Vibrio sp. CAU 1672]